MCFMIVTIARRLKASISGNIRSTGRGAWPGPAWRALIVAVFAAVLPGAGTLAAAEALVTQGIGTSSCAQLAADLNPAEGLANPVNLMLFAWVQGYVSAANIALLDDDARHVDMSTLDGGRIVSLVFDYCKANPDKKPITAIDELIRNAGKIKTQWETGPLDWDK